MLQGWVTAIEMRLQDNDVSDEEVLALCVFIASSAAVSRASRHPEGANMAERRFLSRCLRLLDRLIPEAEGEPGTQGY